MTSIALDLTALIFSAICVAETDGKPMTACDIAFWLDMPREDVDHRLNQLVKDGSILQDGDLFRCDLTRSLTVSEVMRIKDLNDQIEQLRPLLEKTPMRLDS